MLAAIMGVTAASLLPLSAMCTPIRIHDVKCMVVGGWANDWRAGQTCDPKWQQHNAASTIATTLARATQEQ